MACHQVLPTNRLGWIKSHYSQTCPLWQHHHREEWCREKSVTAEQSQNVLSWKEPQGWPDVTHWITVPFRHHLYSCQGPELHSNNFILRDLFSVPASERLYRANSLWVNPNLRRETTQLWLKYATVQQRKQNCHLSKKIHSVTNEQLGIWHLEIPVCGTFFHRLAEL